MNYNDLVSKFFPIFSKNETKVEKTWNLFDIMNFFELCVFAVFKMLLGVIFRILGAIMKFSIILLLTFALAFGIFHYFDRYSTEDPEPTAAKTNKSSIDSNSRPDNKTSDNYPYLINYSSKSDETDAKPKTQRTSGKEKVGMDSDLSEEEVVRVGSFKRSSGEVKSIISKALEDLENIGTKIDARNEDKIKTPEDKSSNA